MKLFAFNLCVVVRHSLERIQDIALCFDNILAVRTEKNLVLLALFVSILCRFLTSLHG